MRYVKSTMLTALMLSVAAPAFADDRPELVIENFVGTINWQQGNKLSLKKIKNEADTLIVEDGDSLRIDGGIDDPNSSNCRGYYGRFEIDLGGSKRGTFGGYKNLEDYPILEITVPTNTRISLSNAIPFANGAPNIASFDGQLTGCGNIELGNVSDEIALSVRGSSDFSAGNTPRAKVAIQGSGDVDLGEVESFDVSIRGSGDLDMGNVGSGKVAVSGSGDVELGDASGDVILTSTGSGDISIGDVSGDLAFEGRGSGDFEADSANGRLSIQTRGSGDVDIDDGDVTDLLITASGSSNVDFGGTANTATLKARGAADISVYRVTGNVDKSTSGSADIDIRKRD